MWEKGLGIQLSSIEQDIKEIYKKWNNATLLTDFLKKYFFLKEYVIYYSRYEF